MLLVINSQDKDQVYIFPEMLAMDKAGYCSERYS